VLVKQNGLPPMQPGAGRPCIPAAPGIEAEIPQGARSAHEELERKARLVFSGQGPEKTMGAQIPQLKPRKRKIAFRGYLCYHYKKVAANF
jgi:hypothetical protein